MKDKDAKIVSVQSLVSTGYVGNNMAMFAAQLHASDVCMLPTVLLSSATDNPDYRGDVIAAELFSELVIGVDLGLDKTIFHYFMTGYISAVALIDTTAAWISSCKDNGCIAYYIYDPVFGDFRTSGLYLSEDAVAHSLKMLLPLCDIMTPNHFEMEYILRGKFETQEELSELLTHFPLLKDKKIIITGAHLRDTPEGYLENLLVIDGHIERFMAARIPIEAVGTGDLFTALVTVELKNGRSISESINYTTEFISAVLSLVNARDSTEIRAEDLLYAKEKMNVLQIYKGGKIDENS
ncbi:PfkB family carbohydrate kinase [Sphingobacterium faecale]|uniref:pyridoxal kinase n=1 Tax=Sphingobacterium faecale TaxID=2803775 RepID=A0ABS1QY67_9SPHI|nr:PfkB family carbohydrate kinase [Sphingobacterium faecale]MBL1407376.1 bifunctional hydroxymethylpyrimidine kinase/phosphomethylpyrimidine kinase [Sphingobacterium faecale]